MVIVPLGVVWAGYLLMWYGQCLIKGPGVGIVDLIVPNRASKIDEAISQWGKTETNMDRPNGGSFVNDSAQLGSIYNPAQPNGGIPSKPTLGNTPPAGYSGN